MEAGNQVGAFVKLGALQSVNELAKLVRQEQIEDRDCTFMLGIASISLPERVFSWSKFEK